MSWDRTDNGTFASSSHMQRHPWRGRGRYQHNRFSGPSYRGRGRSQQFEYTDNQGSTHRHSIGRGVDSMNSVPQHRTNSFDRGIGPFDDHSMQSETPSLDHEVSLFPTTGEAIVESQNVVHSMASDLPDEDNFDTWKMPTMVNEERDDSQWEDAYDMTDEIIADVVVEDKPQVVVDNILAKEEVVVDMGGLEDNPWSIS
ncbi:hypothetical protein B0H34DRAFT_325181 [Crassisporium funariophilum]|nr:hypothetical protein B0H34DRAFT_325181 [Crassisporium funariophilum]